MPCAVCASDAPTCIDITGRSMPCVHRVSVCDMRLSGSHTRYDQRESGPSPPEPFRQDGCDAHLGNAGAGQHACMCTLSPKQHVKCSCKVIRGLQHPVLRCRVPSRLCPPTLGRRRLQPRHARAQRAHGPKRQLNSLLRRHLVLYATRKPR